jgi:hypothetical protein
MKIRKILAHYRLIMDGDSIPMNSIISAVK